MSRRCLALTRCAASLLVLVSAWSCGNDAEYVTPAPDFGDSGRASGAQWTAYIDRLRFGTAQLSEDSVLYQTEQGPSVLHLVSEDGVRGLSDSALSSGRIIARAERRGSAGPYEAPEGVSHLWVDRVGGHWRWFWVNGAGIAGTPRPMVRGTTAFEDSSSDGVRTALDSFPNGRCGRYCCIPFITELQAADSGLLRRAFEDVHSPRRPLSRP